MTTKVKRPLVHRQTDMMMTFRDHEDDSDTTGSEPTETTDNPQLQVTLMKYENCTRSLQDTSKRNVEYFPTMNRELRNLVLFSFEEFTDEEDRRILSNRLVLLGFVEHVIRYYNLVLDELGISAVTLYFMADLTSDLEDQSSIVYTIRQILWNFSDSANSFSDAISKTDLLEKLASDLDAILDDGIGDLETTEDRFPFDSAVGIIHNCARNPMVDKELFRNIGLVGSLIPFLKSSSLYVKMISLLALGNIIKEHEVQMLDAETDIFDFIITAMKQASLSKHRKQFGFHISELCDGLGSMAKSDNNKHLIMEKDPLKLIKDLLRGHNIPEILAAIKLLWEMAFAHSNRIIIQRDKEILVAIESLRKNNNEGISLAATKTWFVLAGRDKLIREDEIKTGSTPVRGKHVMMSYNWVDKDTVNEIYDRLKLHGYTVWIDTAEMGKFDGILDGMMYGVDNAYVVLICYSEKYKNSQNCRTEAEYIFSKRKDIIPLKMQRGYNPDGWLGALIGARIFVEFSPVKPFEKQIASTFQQIDKYKVDDNAANRSSFKPELPRDRADVNQSLLHHAQPGPVKPRPPPIINRKLRDWKKHDIEYWAKENKIEGYAFKKISKLTGEQLHFVYSTLLRKPDTFYTWAETKLRLGSIEDLMRFHDALQCLVSLV